MGNVAATQDKAKPTPDYRSDSLVQLARYSGDPWGPGNAYYQKAEKAMHYSWERVVWPFIGDAVDFKNTLDLAAGHGRNSEYLLRYAETLAIMDIQPSNIEACRARFAERTNISYHVCTGYDMQPLPEGSLTLIYCFDAMVHFDSDVVRSYLRDTRRVLQMGGRAFFHHSNYTGGYDWKKNPHARNFMSREMFAHYADKERLKIVKQEVINWGGGHLGLDVDCLTLVER
jgi:ubiquinone/menaquinone biosynthesis C-methylase UbiE